MLPKALERGESGVDGIRMAHAIRNAGAISIWCGGGHGLRPFLGAESYKM